MIMKRFGYLKGLFALLLTVWLLACSTGSEQKIIIISTNDTHSNIDMFPRLAWLVDSISTNNDYVLLVHAGDWTTGNPYADLYPMRGYPNIALMNMIGYDLATLGNHEFDPGIDTLAARLEQADFPIVVANMDAGGSMPQPDPYRFIEIGGVKLGFLGLITVTPTGYPDGFISNFGKATFSDPIETARGYAPLADSCDLLIGLTHIGYESDSLLALAVPEIGLIIGGHSHTVIPEGKWVGGTLITQAGAKLKYAGVTVITLKDGRVTDISNSLVELTGQKPIAELSSMVAKFKSEGEFGKTAGEATGYFNKNAVMALYADALREGSGADLAVTNRGGVRIDYLNQGRIAKADVFMLEPFGNKAVVAEMTAKQIEEMILNKFNSEGKESHSIELWPSGFSYRVLTDARGEGTKVDLRVGGQAKAKYRVAMSDYVNDYYVFAGQGKGRATGRPITLMITDYLEKKSPLVPSPEVRAEAVAP